jgi:hypothetical protein
MATGRPLSVGVIVAPLERRCASSIPVLQEDYPTVWHGLERHLEG